MWFDNPNQVWSFDPGQLWSFHSNQVWFLPRAVTVWHAEDPVVTAPSSDGNRVRARHIFHWMDGLSPDRAHQVTSGLIRFAVLIKQYTRVLEIGRSS